MKGIWRTNGRWKAQWLPPLSSPEFVASAGRNVLQGSEGWPELGIVWPCGGIVLLSTLCRSFLNFTGDNILIYKMIILTLHMKKIRTDARCANFLDVTCFKGKPPAQVSREWSARRKNRGPESPLRPQSVIQVIGKDATKTEMSKR